MYERSECWRAGLMGDCVGSKLILNPAEGTCKNMAVFGEEELISALPPIGAGYCLTMHLGNTVCSALQAEVLD